MVAQATESEWEGVRPCATWTASSSLSPESAVPPTNNIAERSLRHLVVGRNISGVPVHRKAPPPT